MTLPGSYKGHLSDLMIHEILQFSGNPIMNFWRYLIPEEQHFLLGIGSDIELILRGPFHGSAVGKIKEIAFSVCNNVFSRAK